MRASGNGDKAVCANNLLAIVRGEVPYDRIRGLDARNIDRPAAEAAPDIQQDAEWLLKTYEPRAVVREINVTQDDSAGGAFRVTAEIEQ